MSLNLGQARLDIMAVVAQLKADWPHSPPLDVEIDNRTTIDQSTQTAPYLKVEIKPMSGTQADMADKPRVKQMGQILLYAVAKEGSGSTDADRLLDFVADYFDMKDIGTVRCHAVEAIDPKTVTGWRWCPAIVNYWYFRTSV